MESVLKCATLHKNFAAFGPLSWVDVLGLLKEALIRGGSLGNDEGFLQ